MNNKTIIFYAPFGKDEPANKIGGAEMGCLKTYSCYQSAGYKVVQVHKPTLSNGFFKYLFKLTITPLIIGRLLLSNKNSVLHIAGFYLKLVSYEWFLMCISRICKRKNIYEFRNGGMIESFNHGGLLYKFFIRQLITKSSLVLCQGKNYVDFALNKWNIVTHYYPNYIRNEFEHIDLSVKNYKDMKLVYVGRITESKNIDVIIEIFAIIRQLYPHASLDLIGAFSENYKRVLDALINIKGLSHNEIHFHGRLNIENIHKILLSSSYFLFPSSESREGHSNALTEAMGAGVVPIVSNVGFNKGIVHFDELVQEDLCPKNYAEAIFKIEKENLQKYYSEEVRAIVTSNYTEAIVAEKFINQVEKLFVN